MPQPLYPEGARWQGIEGTVKVNAVVNRKGRVVRTVIVQSVPLLDEQAASVVRRSEWKPALNDGEPIEVWVEIPVRFALE